MNALALTFNDVQFDVVDRNGQPWLRGAQVALALGYSDESSVSRIYARNSDEFTESMTCSVKLTDQTGQGREVRIFSLRGCHLIGMFARTAIAKQFRVWVLDVLEKFTQSQTKAEATPTKPQLPYATKAQREPLIKAVRHLVSIARAKGRALTYENAHNIINLKMGVDSVEALTVEQIPKAMTLVGEILERVVLEGEYFARGEEDQPLPEPEPRLSDAQRRELDRAIGRAGVWECGNESAKQWAHNRLRVMLNLRRIDDMHPDQLPLALAEMERLAQDLAAYFRFCYEQREFVCREIIGAGTPWTPTLVKNWKAQLKLTVPDRPDWLAMWERLLKKKK